MLSRSSEQSTTYHHSARAYRVGRDLEIHQVTPSPWRQGVAARSEPRTSPVCDGARISRLNPSPPSPPIDCMLPPSMHKPLTAFCRSLHLRVPVADLTARSYSPIPSCHPHPSLPSSPSVDPPPFVPTQTLASNGKTKYSTAHDGLRHCVTHGRSSTRTDMATRFPLPTRLDVSILPLHSVVTPIVWPQP
ncbi:hypothetical protein NMY22_g1371 [Coprinellus aureogranulatus]|nr:hypothetical protein NMY22_g1371 [Coprinellus aureogranulatus]